MAGNRQQSRFLALVGNVDQYTKALELANNAEDASAQQVLKTMDSIPSKIQNVQTAFQQFYASMGLENLFKGVLDTITTVINNINKMSKGQALVTFVNIFGVIKNVVMGIFSSITVKFQQFKAEFEKVLNTKKQTDVDYSKAKDGAKDLGEAIQNAVKAEADINFDKAKQGAREVRDILNGTSTPAQPSTPAPVPNAATTPAVGPNAANYAGWFATLQGSGVLSNTALKKIAGGDMRLHTDYMKQLTKQGLTEDQAREFATYLGESLKAGNYTRINDTNKNDALAHLQTSAQGAAEGLEKVKQKAEEPPKEPPKPKQEPVVSRADAAMNALNKWGTVAAQAFQAAGAAVSAFALTLEDNSQGSAEKTKVTAGFGSMLSSVGSSITGALIGSKAGIPGMIIGAIVGGLPSLLTGISQLVDGYTYTTVERLKNAENELKELQNIETRAKAKSSAYTNALKELEQLRDAQYDSAEAAEEYKEKMNTLGQSYPELISCMDSAGNAIIDASDLEDKLARARFETAKATSETLAKELQMAKLEQQRLDNAKREIEADKDYLDLGVGDTSTIFAQIPKGTNIEDIESLLPILNSSNAEQNNLISYFNDVSAGKIDPDTVKDNILQAYGLKREGGNIVTAMNDIAFDTGMNRKQLEDDREKFPDFVKSDLLGAAVTYLSETTLAIEEALGNQDLTVDKLGLASDWAKLMNIQNNPDNYSYNDTISAINNFYAALYDALGTETENLENLTAEAQDIFARQKANEVLSNLAITEQNYKGILENYSGIYSVLGGALLDKAFEEDENRGEKDFSEWVETADTAGILGDLEKLPYDVLSEIWDNFGSYNASELTSALTNALDGNDELIPIIVDYYNNNFEFVRELAVKQAIGSKSAGKLASFVTKDKDGFTRINAALYDDINNTIQAADELYEQGYTARANTLADDAWNYYTAVKNLSADEFTAVKGILDNLSLTDAEAMIAAKTQLEALGGDDYNGVIDALSAAIENTYVNINALAQTVADDAVAAIEGIDSAISGFTSGMGVKDVSEAYTKLQTYKDLLGDNTLSSLFEYNSELGKYVYSIEGIGIAMEGMTKQIREQREKVNSEITERLKDEGNDTYKLQNLDDLKDITSSADLIGKEFYDSGTDRQQEFARWVVDNQKELKNKNEDEIYTAYEEYVKSQGAAAQEILDLIFADISNSFGKSLDLKGLISGTLDMTNYQKQRAAVKEMVKKQLEGQNKTLAEIEIETSKAMIAAVAGDAETFASLTGFTLSEKDIVEALNTKRTQFIDAFTEVLGMEAGTYVDETTAALLANTGLVEKEGGHYVVQKGVEFETAVAKLLATGGEAVNQTIIELYRRTIGLDEIERKNSLSSKTSLSVEDIVEQYGDTILDKDGNIKDLAAQAYLKRNKFTGEYDITNFEKYWESLENGIGVGTAEYLAAYSDWVDEQIEKTTEIGSEAKSQLDDLLDAKAGEKINVSYLEQIAPEIGKYLGGITDGVATITGSENLGGLLTYITNLQAQEGKLQTTVGELRDQIIELISGWTDAIGAGIQGSLSFEDAETLKNKFGLSDIDFTETKEGLQLSRDAAFALYEKMKQIAPIQAQLVFDELSDSLADARDGYEDVASTMKKIVELNKQLANPDVSDDRRKELLRELAVAKEILQVRSEEPEAFNFMDKELPTNMQGPINYWNSVGKAYKVMNESAKSGYMEIQDYVNIINQMEAMALAAGQKFEIGGMDAATLINQGFAAIKNVDGEGAKIALEGLGIDFANAATDAGMSFDEGIKEVAKSQIAMLDAAIQILETMVAFEEIGKIDQAGDGIDFGDILLFNGDGTVSYETGYEETITKIKQAASENEELMTALQSVFIGGKSIYEWMNLGANELAKLGPEAVNEFAEALEALSSMSDFDFSKNNVISELQNLITQFGFGGTIITPIDKNGFQVILKAGAPESITIEWNSERVKKILEENNVYNEETLQKLVVDWAQGNTNSFTTLDFQLVYQLIGNLTFDEENKTWTFLGNTYTSEDELNKAIANYNELTTLFPDLSGETFSAGSGGEVTITKDFPILGEITFTNNGVSITYEGQTYTADNIEALKETLFKETGIGEQMSEEDFDTIISGKASPKIEVEQPEIIEPKNLEGDITQEIIDTYGIDTAQVNTIAAAFSTVDWGPVGKQIGEGISNALKGENAEGVPLDSLTISPATLKIDATSATPELVGLEDGIELPVVNATFPENFTAQTQVLTDYQSAISSLKELGTIESPITVTLTGITSETPQLVQNYSDAASDVPEDPINSSVSATVDIPLTTLLAVIGLKEALVALKGNENINATVVATAEEKTNALIKDLLTAAGYDDETINTVVNMTDNLTVSQVVDQIDSITDKNITVNANLNVEGAHQKEDGTMELTKATQPVDVVMTDESKSAIRTFLEEVADFFKNLKISITYEEPTPVGPTPTAIDGETSYYATYHHNDSGVPRTVQKQSLQEVGSQLGSYIQNGITNSEPQFEVTKIEADGTETTVKATLAEIQLGTVDFGEGNGGGSGGDKDGPTPTPTPSSKDSGGTPEKVSVFEALRQSGEAAATAIGEAFTTMATTTATAGSDAASKIQTAFDNIKVPTPTISVRTPTVNIPVNYTITITTTGGTGNITGTNGNTKSGTIYPGGSGSKNLAKGNVALATGNRKTLMGELGPELVVSNGRYFVVGQNGAEFVNLADDAIVFNHLQTQRLLSKGHAGTGRPITNERKATSLATGNVDGPAMASASEALAQLRSIRAMWQAMLDASAQDLGSKAGSGGGGGGGGGGGEDIKAVTNELERWYNLLRQIESLEQHITLEQAKRANMMSGYDYVDSLAKELDMLKEQQKAYKLLSDLQKDYYDRRRADLLSTDYSKIFTYTEHGLMQYVDGENRGLDILAKLNERDANGKLINHAKNAKTQLAYLKSIGFNTSVLKYNEDGTTAKKEEEQMENFWARVDGWMEELDGLYDSYHEGITNFEEATEKMNEILQEYIDNQLAVEEKLLKAIEDREQAEIDRLEDQREALEKAASAYIDGLNEVLTKEREMYDKNETNAETQRLQRQLAILQRSGGSATEIKSLQDQIDSRLKDAYFEEQQSQIDAIQEASDKQLEKLQTQIDLMTETLEYQKENGLLWQEVYEMMNSWSPERMLQFIEEFSAEYKSNSALQNEEASKETLKELEIFAGKRESDAIEAAANARNAAWLEYYNSLTGYSEEFKAAHQENAEKAFKEAYGTGDLDAGKAAADKVYEDAQRAEEESKTQPPTVEESKVSQNGKVVNGNMNVRSSASASSKSNGIVRSGGTFTAVGYKNGWLKVEGANASGKIVSGYMKYDKYQKYYSGINVSKLPQFSSGGLIDFTGPAMVHGSKSKPEGILSAEQTALLKKGIFSNSNYSLVAAVQAIEELTSSIASAGNITNETGINIEHLSVEIQPGTISSDYDARRAGEMALEEMVRIARKTTNRVVSK